MPDFTNLGCMDHPYVPAVRSCGCTTMSDIYSEVPAVVRVHPCRTYLMHARNARDGMPISGLVPIRGL